MDLEGEFWIRKGNFCIVCQKGGHGLSGPLVPTSLPAIYKEERELSF